VSKSVKLNLTVHGKNQMYFLNMFSSFVYITQVYQIPYVNYIKVCVIIIDKNRSPSRKYLGIKT